ncbi:DnrO protein [uncultured Stenotrophomonas sp.]|uniref:DnrO protein n=1 Tax=uncultured Stenotrophomonas sp. TaxID=165438 RepID=A0A1Y5Q467_9GAMM|nr:DnrO protein [uncultured Stenotrophomonas sp.]
MRHLIPLSATTLVLAGLFALPAAARPVHDHAHAAHTPQAPAAAPAQQWPSDASLREGMRRIRVAVQGLEHYEHGHIGIAQASATTTLIDEAIAGMFAGCKLEPDADVVLHGLLAEFMAGAEAVRTSPQVPVAEIARMRQALARYPQLFDDPRWDVEAD